MTIANKDLDKRTDVVVSKTIDKSPSIVLAKPDVEAIKRARRWLRGAAMLLADASNGDEFVVRIAAEAAVLANMAEIAVAEYED